MKDKQIPAIMQSKRQIRWLACALCLIILVGGAIKPAREAYGQAMGVRRLLQAEASLPEEVLANPFVCLRAVNIADLGEEINFNNDYLLGVSLCLFGDPEAGVNVLKQARLYPSSLVQYAGGISSSDPVAGADALAQAGLTKDTLLKVVQKLLTQPEIDPYPYLRVLGQRVNDNPDTWRLWLQGSSLWETENEWQAALDWIDEGLAVAPGSMQSSLLLRKGRIFQTKVEPKDYQSAIGAYNQALKVDGWINPREKATAHMYLAEVYKAQKDIYSSAQVLSEYEAALAVSPGNYSALLNIGHLYLNDFKDLDQAEAYYQQAMQSDPQNPNAYLYLGDVYRTRGALTTAQYWYQQALVHKPDWQPAIDRLDALEGK